MSWGERSCIHWPQAERPSSPTFETCNANCEHYEWDKKTKPDSFRIGWEKNLLKAVMSTPTQRRSRSQKNRWKRQRNITGGE